MTHPFLDSVPRRSRRAPALHALPRLCAGALLLALGVQPSLASVLGVRPLVFANDPAYSQVATGTLETVDGTASIVGWNLTVTTRETLGHYTAANTINASSGVLGSDGTSLTVATSPDGIDDGGALYFRARNPVVDVGVAPADFTAANLPGGAAYYLAVFASDALPLAQPDGGHYVAAMASAGGANVFELVPQNFSGGVVMRGTITTNGALGALTPADITAWDITIEQITEDVFTQANSVLQASGLGLTRDGADVTVDDPDGYLRFTKGIAGGHLYSLDLATFGPEAPRGGEAAYRQGRVAVTTLPLLAARGPWRVTGSDAIVAPVPEPAEYALWLLGLAGLVASRRRLQLRMRVHAKGLARR